jgi:hypothetical protein
MKVNLWAIISLLIGLIDVILGVYILRKGPTRSLNRVFSLFVFSLALWGISEFGHRTTDTYEIAVIWIKGGGLGWCFMASLYLHFALILTKHESLLEKEFAYVALYLPPVVFLGLFLFTDLIYEQIAVLTRWGYTAVPGTFSWTFVSYYTLVYLLTVFYLASAQRKGSALEKKQAKSMLIGTTVFLVTGTASNITFPMFHLQLPEIGSCLSIILTLSTAYAILRHKLFIIVPRLEEIEQTEQKYSLEAGLRYIIKEKKPDKGYEIFKDQLRHGRFGLCLSKFHPKKVRDAYALERTPIVWVTFREGENTVSPRDMAAMESVVFDFLSQAQRPVILIDCLNEIRLANGIDKTVHWLQRIKSICNDKDCILLLSVNPDLLEERELAVIERGIEEEE